MFILFGGVKFDINIFVFQEVVKVGYLCYYFNGIYNSKWCGNNFVCYIGYYVIVVGSDFVYCNS